MIDIIKMAKKEKKKILLNESEDKRVFKAIRHVVKNKIADVAVVKTKGAPLQKLKKMGVEIFDHEDFPDFPQKFYIYRNGKTSLEECQELIKKPNYFATMLVKEGYADGLVSGAVHPTRETLIPAFQLLNMGHKASGAFIMRKGKNVMLFADCAVNISPTPDEIAYIAHDTIKTTKLLKIKPKVAFLSYSTNGSGINSEGIRKAYEIFKKLHPGVQACGEIQVDAALSQKVRSLKWKNCKLKGRANVLIFPDLNSGNIGYKLVQWLGGYEAIGPIIQGLEKPVNDLSRGCNEKEIVDLVALTAIQARGHN